MLPGLTRQVWLTVHSANLPPGVHHGKIFISTEHRKLKVPLTLEVYPIRFPELPTLHLGGWDYTDADSHNDITPQNRAAVIAHLREHFVDSPWATAAVLPLGQQDAEGNFIATPDTASLDRWIERWRGARQSCVFAAVGGQVGESVMGTPAFEKKVVGWIRFWSEHARRLGLKPEQLALLLVDEPTEANQDAIILALGKGDSRSPCWCPDLGGSVPQRSEGGGPGNDAGVPCDLPQPSNLSQRRVGFSRLLRPGCPAGCGTRLLLVQWSCPLAGSILISPPSGVVMLAISRQRILFLGLRRRGQRIFME